MTVGRGPWAVEEVTSPVAEFHARALPDPVVRTVWWQRPARPTVVLGSTQSDAVVDRGRAEAGGVDVVRRRSGGGAVWLTPGAVTWVDVVVPAADPLWLDDVGRAAHWLGEVWVAALAPWVSGPLTVHRGPMVRTAWSDLVCFAGLGAGEVTAPAPIADVRPPKLVGISQRRTRDGARFQCAVLHRWDPEPLLAVLALDPEARAHASGELADVATGLTATVSGREVVDAFVGRLRA